MEMKKYTIADKEFTMKFPSYKRCENVRSAMGVELQNMSEGGNVKDVSIFLKGMEECLDGDFSIFNPEEISSGQMTALSGAMLDFFTLSREIV